MRLEDGYAQPSIKWSHSGPPVDRADLARWTLTILDERGRPENLTPEEQSW